MAWDDGLKGGAWDIAASQAKRLRVMAGPGTGKSYALKRRVTRLLEEGHDPRRILVVTFTRTAAESLVEDLTNLDVPGCDKIPVSTLHSYCFGLLARDEVFAVIDRVPRTLNTITESSSLQFEGAMLINDLIDADHEFGGKRECTKRIRAFDAAWARLQNQDPGWPLTPIDRRFHEHLTAWLHFHRAMLVGELVPVALDYLRDNPDSGPPDAFDHVIVDEYQDLNRAEQDIIDRLGKRGDTAIVGDVDQSIYSFRHANPEGIDAFGTRHPNTHDESLELCHRCPTRVVELADHLIRHNYDPAEPPRLRPKPDNPKGDIHLVQWSHPIEEARGLARYVGELLRESDYGPEDIMILTPRRKLAYQLRDFLRRENVPVHSSYREEALEAESAQRAFALLTLLSQPDDRVALRWWLGRNSSNGLAGTYRKLRNYCETTGLSPWDALAQVCDGTIAIKGVARLLGSFQELRETLERLRPLSLAECISDLLPETDAGCTLLREEANLAMEHCEDVGDLIEHLRTFTTQPEAPTGEFVRIMSLQKAKGLTSPVVIVTACIKGLIPNVDADLPDADRKEQLREQRRLFYVAITRCKEVLVLSSLASMQTSLAFSIGAELRSQSGGFGKAITSQFIRELGPAAPARMSGSEWISTGFMSE